MQAEFPPPDALALWLVNVVDHNQSPLMMACTSLNRNRTPPRTRTRVKRPQAASRSIVRSEHASISATSLFRSSLSVVKSAWVFIIISCSMVGHCHRTLCHQILHLPGKHQLPVQASKTIPLLISRKRSRNLQIDPEGRFQIPLRGSATFV